MGYLTRLILLLLVVSQIAATCQGTETGNPGTTPNKPCSAAVVLNQTTTQGSDQAVDDLLSVICQRVLVCGIATTTDTCFNALDGTAGDKMTDNFGLTPAGQYTITQVRADLINGTLSVNQNLLSTCETDISTTPCTSITQNITSNDFSKTENLIPQSCSGVFVQVNRDTVGPSSGGCK
ncbi:MAG: hypothetical protein HY073_03090 [Deltaproteobacteria bacterium]|nr:hypothetical protein [Deltaproteobacteria bacterium]